MYENIIEYLKNHALKLAEEVNHVFEVSKAEIRQQLLQEIKSYLKPVPIHYEWQYDGNPLDYSGILVKAGSISLNQTISEFLEKEYTGDYQASYESGHGWQYLNYGDKLFYLTNQIGADILWNTVRQHIETVFDCKLSDDDFLEIMNIGKDDIDDNSLSGDFFFYENAIEFTGIGSIMLFNLI